MTAQRFDFQRACAGEVGGVVLNIGCNTDPAQLKATFGDRIINCDVLQYDPVLDQPILADLVFDCTQEWPLEADDAALVILGDILEHLSPAEQAACLREAARVAPRLCVTVPNDARFLSVPETRLPEYPGLYHNDHITEAALRERLIAAGYVITHFQTVDYTFVPEGYFVLAHREGSV